MNGKINHANSNIISFQGLLDEICLNLLPTLEAGHVRKTAAQTHTVKYDSIKRALKSFPNLLIRVRRVCQQKFKSRMLRDSLDRLKFKVLNYESAWLYQLKTKNWKNYGFTDDIHRKFLEVERKYKNWVQIMNDPELLSLVDFYVSDVDTSDSTTLDKVLSVETYKNLDSTSFNNEAADTHYDSGPEVPQKDQLDSIRDRLEDDEDDVGEILESELNIMVDEVGQRLDKELIVSIDDIVGESRDEFDVQRKLDESIQSSMIPVPQMNVAQTSNMGLTEFASLSCPTSKRGGLKTIDLSISMIILASGIGLAMALLRKFK